MSERLSFFIERPSPLHRLNPLTKLTLTLTLILSAFWGPGYWWPTVLFVFGLIPLSLWGRIHREFFSTAFRLLLPLFGFLFVMQSLFYPGGQTVWLDLRLVSVKAEGVAFAYLTASRLLIVTSSFLLLLLSTAPSALLTDLTRRGFPGQLAYIIVSTLQIIPQMRAKANTIIDAQRSRGLETQGHLLKRIRALLPLVGPLVFGSLVDVEERAIAIESRAFTAKRPKTSLIEIPDPPVERAARWGMILLAGLTILVGILWR